MNGIPFRPGGTFDSRDLQRQHIHKGTTFVDHSHSGPLNPEFHGGTLSLDTTLGPSFGREPRLHQLRPITGNPGFMRRRI